MQMMTLTSSTHVLINIMQTLTGTYQSRVRWDSLLTAHLSVCTRSGNAAQAHWSDHPLCKETGNYFICKIIFKDQSNNIYVVARGNALKCVVQSSSEMIRDLVIKSISSCLFLILGEQQQQHSTARILL